MTAGGVEPGFRHGKTDEYGYAAVEIHCTIDDFPAKSLHIMGTDHTKLTYPSSGRYLRLNDLFCEPATETLA